MIENEGVSPHNTACAQDEKFLRVDERDDL